MRNLKDSMPQPNSHRFAANPAAIPMPWARAPLNGADLDLQEAPPGTSATDVALGDWDDLLNAVKARLRLTVCERLAQLADTPELQLRDAAGGVRAGVLECVAALDQLQGTLAHELARRERLELEVFNAQIALVRTRVELAGTQANERRARHRASHDALTLLPNRSFFRERLDHALACTDAQSPALAVLFLDLDGFKPINDTHGHAAGDALLRIVASRLARAVRAEDMVGRLGGDEFACLLYGAPGREHLGQLACKLFDAVSAPFRIGALELTVHPSIGIAMCPADGTSAEVLLKNADAAMYRAKRHRSGYAFVERGGEPDPSGAAHRSV